MAKFFVGDKVRCIAADSFDGRKVSVGDILTVYMISEDSTLFRAVVNKEVGMYWIAKFELATKLKDKEFVFRSFPELGVDDVSN